MFSSLCSGYHPLNNFLIIFCKDDTVDLYVFQVNGLKSYLIGTETITLIKTSQSPLVL